MIVAAKTIAAAGQRLAQSNLRERLGRIDGDQAHRILPEIWPYIKDILTLCDAGDQIASHFRSHAELVEGTVLGLENPGGVLRAREVLWSDEEAIFSVRVGRNVDRVSYASANGQITYCRFRCTVPGGHVDHIVRARKVPRGKNILAQVAIIRSTFDGGSSLHVEIVPITSHKRPTHRLCVLHGKESMNTPSVSFETHGEGRGVIVIALAHAKVVPAD